MDFKDKVVYQIYPKSFKDTTGSGVGDIRGMIEKLDYLAWLGVDYIWTTPFFVSPQCDNGYDVADYCAINPDFGTMADVEELIAEGKKRKIGLIFDMVFNHTSTEHEWFQKALAGDEKYQNYYFFVPGTPDKPPTNWQSKFVGSAWKYVEHLGKWYLHLFAEGQADLNWENPEVREELKKVIRFWKGKGVAGFRFDVVNLISKPAVEDFVDDQIGDGKRFYTDGRHVHEFLKELVADTEIGDMITVGEMSATSLENCRRYAGADSGELSMVFTFHHLKIDYRNGDKWQLMTPDIKALKELFTVWQEGMQAADAWNAVFWCNHDQPRIVSRLGDDKKYWAESAKMLAASIHLMCGTPYIYQGEEIGMTNAYYDDISLYRDVESKNAYQAMLAAGRSKGEALEVLRQRSRDNSRTPMQWDSSKNAGFTTGQPWMTVNDNSRAINVAAQKGDMDSILHFYRQLIRLRKQEPAIAEGKIRFIEKATEKVLAYVREHDDSEILVYANFSEKMQPIHEADLLNYTQNGYEKMIGNYHGVAAVLRPYEVIAFKK